MENGKPILIGVNVAERRDGGKVSLHKDYYSSTYANLGVPASAFITMLKKVIAETP